LFVVEYCLAKTFINLGITPKKMIGHSIGEYTAACLAGVFSLEDALWLVSERGRLMAQSPKGAMVAILDSRAHVEELLFDSLCISIENSPDNTVVSGSESDIEKLITILLSKSIHHKKLINQHAFHSAFMDPILEEFSQVVEKIQLNPPCIDIISSTPDYSCSDLNTSEYWVQHLRKEVCFHDAVKQSIHDSDIMLEVGPGAALCSFVQSSMSNENTLAISSMANAKYADKEQSIFLNSLGQLWCMGIEVEFKKIGIGTEGKAFGLPTYEFSKQEYWLERKIAKIGEAQIDESETSIVPHQKSETILDVESSLLEIWKQVLGITDLKVDDNYFEIGGDSLLSVDLFSKIKVKYKITLPISTLFTHPTISLLTKKLSDELKVQNKTEDTLTCNNRDEPWDTSVVMHPGPAANEKTLFIVGGVGGNVNNLYDLAKSLGKEYQVVGLQTRGILDHNYHDTVEEMARDHIQYIQKHQPEGPCLLVGYSYGAYTAFEIAKQFEESGRKVEFLGLLDVYAPGLTHNAPELPTAIPKFKKWLEKCNWYWRKGGFYTLNILISKMKNRYFVEDTEEFSSEHLRYEKFFLYWKEVSEKYLGGKVSTKIDLFLAPNLNYKEKLWRGLDETQGWKNMSKNGVNVININFGHIEMMEQENSKDLAKLIKKSIQKEI